MTTIPCRDTSRMTSIPGPNGLKEKGLASSLAGVCFGSSWAGETREHEEALERWFQSGCSGPAPRRGSLGVPDETAEVVVEGDDGALACGRSLVVDVLGVS